MRRMFALIVLVLSLALASGPAFAVPADGCPTAGSSSSGTSHDEMGCCKPDCAPNCAMLCPGAVVPLVGGDQSPAGAIGAHLVALTAAPLHSTDLAGVDPPPRTTFS